MIDSRNLAAVLLQDRDCPARRRAGRGQCHFGNPVSTASPAGGLRRFYSRHHSRPQSDGDEVGRGRVGLRLRGFLSERNRPQMRLVLPAAMSVEPEPRNRSRTISSRLVTSRMASSSMAIGLTVGWSVRPQGKPDSFASHLHKNASCHLAVAMTYSELSSFRVEEIDSVSEV